MTSPLFGRVAVIGTGVIGASALAGIQARDLAFHTAAHDVREDYRHLLQRAGLASSIHADAGAAIAGAELVLLAVPPSALETVCRQIAPHLAPHCIVTDVTSVKRYAIARIVPCLPPQVHFVPGHPIAGSETIGPAAADAGMFEARRVILTPNEEDVLSEPVNRVRQLWQALGAQVECMPASLHDRLYAYISHLPQVMAFACMPSVPPHATACEGVLRLSRSNPDLWAEICLANADCVREALNEFSMIMGQMYHELREHAEEGDTGDMPPEQLLCAVVALCLVATALLLEQHTGLPAAHYSGKGFKDMTAAAGNQADSVLSAISSSPAAVALLLEKTLGRLNRIDAALSTGDAEKLARSFGE